MADPIVRNLVKQFLTKNFKPLFSSNELGALGKLGNTSDDLIKEFGSLPSYEITEDAIRDALSGKTRAIDMYNPKAGSFQSGYTGLVRDPLKDFSVRGKVSSIGKDPTLATDASILEGKTIVPMVGDRIIRGADITGIGALDFENPVRTYGGIQFMDDSLAAWASKKGAMQGKQNVIETIDKMGGKPVAMPVTMAERGGDFSLDTANLIIESFKSMDLPKSRLNKITKLIKETVDAGETPFKKVPNLNNIDDFAKYFRTMPGTARALLVKTLDKDALQKAGAPNIGQIRLASTNPGLYAEDWLGMGARFVDLDPKLGVLKSKHPSYDSQLMKAKDAETYTFGTTVPHTIMLRKIMQNRRDAGKYGNFKPQSADYKTLEMSPANIEVVDPQLIDEASKFLEIKRNLGDREAYEYAQKLIPAT
jgi:hypothetical protein